MTTINIKDKEYKIQYGYRVTWKSGIVKDLVLLSEIQDNFERIDKVMSMLPNLILVGLQKHHEEFAYDYDTEEDKEDKIARVCDLLDDYFDEEEADFEELFNTLQNELLENGFLAALFRQEAEKEQEKKSKKK